jgi:hypothetical protein
MKRRKKRHARKRREPARAAIAMPAPGHARRGRPRTNDPVPPTPETLAKLQPDLLDQLVKREAITLDEASAGRECLDAWEVITGPVAIRTRLPGYSLTDSALSERLQLTWRRWANGMFARTHVRHFVVIEWIQGERAWDTGATSALAKALRWWQQAGRDVSRGTAQQHHNILTIGAQQHPINAMAPRVA